MEEKEERSSGRYLLYGGVAGMIAKTTTAPLERVKILLQVAEAQNITVGVPKGIGVRDAFRFVLQDGGWRGMWKGNLMDALRVIPSTSIRFAMFDWSEKQYVRFFPPPPAPPSCVSSPKTPQLDTLFTDPDPNKQSLLLTMLAHFSSNTTNGPHTKNTTTTISSSTSVPTIENHVNLHHDHDHDHHHHHYHGSSLFWKRFICGSVAGVTATMITYPIDFVRLRWTIQTGHLQSQNLHYTSHLHATMQIAREEGLRGFYKGSFVTCLGAVPYIATNFVLYGYLRDSIVATQSSPTFFQSLLIGAFSGTISMTITYPSDPIHKRMVIDGYRGSPGMFPTLPAAVRTIWLHEGVFGFFRGLVPSLLKVVPSQALSWAVVELGKKWYG